LAMAVTISRVNRAGVRNAAMAFTWVSRAKAVHVS